MNLKNLSDEELEKLYIEISKEQSNKKQSKLIRDKYTIYGRKL